MNEVKSRNGVGNEKRNHWLDAILLPFRTLERLQFDAPWKTGNRESC